MTNFNVQDFLAVVIDAFAQQIAKMVIAHSEQRLELVENAVLEMGQRMKTVENAGSALLALNLDDEGFRSKLAEFVDVRVAEGVSARLDRHVQTETHWGEDDIQRLAREAFDSNEVFKNIEDDIDDKITERLTAHDEDSEAHQSMSVITKDDLTIEIREAFGDDDNVRKVIDEIEAYHGDQVVNAICDAPERDLQKLADKLSARLVTLSDKDIANIAGNVFVERLRTMMTAADRTLDAEVVR